MKSKPTSFTNRHGEVLSGEMEFPPEGQIRAYALFAHCFTCGKDQHTAKQISRFLSLNNIAVFRFDFTGIGESTGNFSDTNFSSNVSDIKDAVRFLKEKHESPSLLIGHSWGGTAALLAAKDLPTIQGICTIGSPFDPSHIEHLMEGSMKEIEKKGYAQVNLGSNTINIQQQFLEDIKQNRNLAFIHELQKALLIFHSPQDRIVSIDNATKIYKAARHPKSFISLDKADHLLTEQKYTNFVGNMIGSWAQHYLNFDVPVEKEVKTPYQTISRITDNKYTTQIWSGNHHWIADEPEKMGGDNLGPSPYDMLSAALGTCTAMTLRMYANRKKWDLQEVEVHVENSKEHMDDLQAGENSRSKIDVFRRYVTVKGELDEVQINRLLEIADKCPVHKTLSSSSKIITSLFNP